jgi:hypothetical protein
MRLFFGIVVAMLLAACGGASSPSATAPTSPAGPSAAPSASAPATAIDTDALIAAAAANDGKPVRVKGFLLAVDDVARMCALVLESYPPQCGGGTVSITGEIPADVVAGLDRTSDPGLAQAMWGWVEVTGTFDASGATPTIQLSGISLAAP